jgi:hypothetical protein
MQASLVSDA